MVRAMSERQIPTEDPLQNAQVVITGRLASMTHEDAAELVRRHGGEPSRVPTRRTTLVVVGQESWPLPEDGQVGDTLERARRYQREGRPLEILSEQEFLERLRLAGEQAAADLQHLYTTTQLSRILRVPGRRVRAWVRNGLIQPVHSVGRLDYFDFRQVAAVKTLRELTDGGVAPRTIHRTLEQLRRWLPEGEEPLAHLEHLEGDRSLLVKLDDGRRMELSGQLCLDFAEQPTKPEGTTALEAGPSPVDSVDWFEQAVSLEEHGNLAEAAAAYERALEEGEPSAEVAFNLGNVHYSLGRAEEAIARFEQALELDPEYVEAWNNLASVHAELEHWEEAVTAGRHALALAPDYPDTHYNLAEAYFACGRLKDARHHGRIYLSYDISSDWAKRLRWKLGLGHR